MLILFFLLRFFSVLALADLMVLHCTNCSQPGARLFELRIVLVHSEVHGGTFTRSHTPAQPRPLPRCPAALTQQGAPSPVVASGHSDLV